MAEELSKRISRRYAALIKKLGEQRGFKRGWKTEVADLLDIDPSYLPKLMDGRRDVGAEALQRAIGRLGIDSAFFTQPYDNEAELDPDDFRIKPGSDRVGSGRFTLRKPVRGVPLSEIRTKARAIREAIAKGDGFDRKDMLLLAAMFRDSNAGRLTGAVLSGQPDDPWTWARFMELLEELSS